MSSSFFSLYPRKHIPCTLWFCYKITHLSWSITWHFSSALYPIDKTIHHVNFTWLMFIIPTCAELFEILSYITPVVLFRSYENSSTHCFWILMENANCSLKCVRNWFPSNSKIYFKKLAFFQYSLYYNLIYLLHKS